MNTKLNIIGIDIDNIKPMKPRILLVEDNKELLEVITEELHDDYEVLKAADGVQALKLLSTEAVQLVISDVMMPVMDGFELCKEIKLYVVKPKCSSCKRVFLCL